MAHVQYKGSDAIKEYLLAGHEISLMEAMLLFGVQNLNAELARLRKTGFVVQKETRANGEDFETSKSIL